jgi:hypothetical protein
MDTLTAESQRAEGHLVPQVESTSPLRLWPSLRRAAALLNINPATLSRRRPSVEPYGQERRISPTLVLELGDRYYRRREIGELAAALVEQARHEAQDPEDLATLEQDVERYLATTRAVQRQEPGDPWLIEARKRLPLDLYERVRLATAGDQRIESFRGTRFAEKDEG